MASLLRKIKGILDMFYHRLSILKGDADYVKSRVAMMEAVLIEEEERRLDHSLLLTPMDRFQRDPEAIIRTCLHLYKNYHTTIQGD